jgi:hypothetical protein
LSLCLADLLAWSKEDLADFEEGRSWEIVCCFFDRTPLFDWIELSVTEAD